MVSRSEVTLITLQGLLLAWNFDQPEAEAAFRLVAEADANSSMAHWGIQYTVGPGANRWVPAVHQC